MKFYSKEGEDYLLWKFFGEKKRGFFVDIGAFDGIHMSNTFTFEQNGWEGVCIEPNPPIFKYCKKNRPGSFCLNEACVGSPKLDKVKFYVEDLGLLSGTIHDDNKLLDVKKRYAKRGLKFNGFKEIECKARPLNRILKEHYPKLRKIDFINIDTEGSECDVLMGIDFEKYDIRVLVVETNKEKDEKKISKFLKMYGRYELARKLDVNSIYVKASDDIRKMRDIKIHCSIEPQQHPFGPEFTHRIFFKKRVICQ